MQSQADGTNLVFGSTKLYCFKNKYVFKSFIKNRYC